VVEHASNGGSVASIEVGVKAAAAIRAGDHIRRRGENARADDEVVGVGTELSASALGALAAAGCGDTKVYAKLRVAVITTGDELVPWSVKPGPFEVRNSNGVVLWTILESHGWLRVEAVTHNGDDVEQLTAQLREMVDKVDAVVLSGGVSMGHRDPVRAAVEVVGGEVVFHGLPQRPGKPMLGAVVRRAGRRAIPVFGLPGNPVSAMVTCVRIVAPVLAACAGAVRRAGTPRVALANGDGKTLDLWWHRLVRMNDRGEAELVDGRGSGDIIAGGRSDGFIEVPPRSEGPIPMLFAYYPWPV
jgi:molybdopterin molybdotransferase